jgi:hypothetical protein
MFSLNLDATEPDGIGEVMTSYLVALQKWKSQAKILTNKAQSGA